MTDVATPPITPATPVTPASPPTPDPNAGRDKFTKPDGSTDVDALRKSYDELQKKLGTPKPETPPAEPEGLGITPDAPNALANLLTVETILKKSGLKPEELKAQWEKSGELTPAQYSKFGLAGLSKELAHELVSGIAAKATLKSQSEAKFRAEGDAIAGGKEQHDLLRDWAKSNIPAPKLKAWAQLVDSDPANYVDMVRMIAAEYAAKNGDKADLISAESVAAGSAKPAENSKEFSKLFKLHTQGDAAATARINATSQSTIDSWNR